MKASYLDMLQTSVLICNTKGIIEWFNKHTELLFKNITTGESINNWIDYSRVKVAENENFEKICQSVSKFKTCEQSLNLPVTISQEASCDFKFSFLENENVIVELVETTDLHRKIDTLSYKESIFDNVLSHINEAIIGFNSDSDIEYLSIAAERLFHITLEEASLEDIYILFSEPFHDLVKKTICNLQMINQQIVQDIDCTDSNNRVFPTSTIWWKSITKNLDMYFVHITDLTMLKNFMNGLDGAFFRLNNKAIVVDANAKVKSIFSQHADTLKGKHLSDLKISLPNEIEIFTDPENLTKIEKDHPVTINSGQEDSKLCELNVWPQETQTGKLFNIIMHDITEKKKREKLLADNAYTDSLTGLANRHYLMEYLAKKTAPADRRNSAFTLLMLDLDGFKTVNDTHGHDYGDELLKNIGTRLHRCVREGDLVVRLGGDEFIVVLTGLSSIDQINSKTEEILRAIRKNQKVLDITLSVSTSVGIARFPMDATKEVDLLKYADLAMYASKKSGKNKYQFYSAQLYERQKRASIIQGMLPMAVERNAFFLVYQPKFLAPEMQVYGVEALLRWNADTLGLVGPDEFIKIAEESGYISEIDRWVIKNTILQWAKWLESSTILKKYLSAISINISASGCNDSLYQYIKETIEQTSIKPSFIELEITETCLIHNICETIQTMEKLKELGVRISIDDFGKGYSSLQYLKELPIDCIKIDRSFIKDICEIDKNKFLVEAIANIANRLGLDVLAEGVETQKDLDCLITLGCNKYQGFLLSKPLPKKDIIPFIIQNVTTPNISPKQLR